MKGIKTESNTETTYTISQSEGKIKNVRTAEIIFREGLFHRCKFDLQYEIYCIEDWEFLGIVSDKIASLQNDYDIGEL